MYVWQWQDHTLTWRNYDSKISEFLNKMYKPNIRTMIQIHYEIDFKAMTEENIQTGLKRNIRRIQT